jgi:hypothetical protein
MLNQDQVQALRSPFPEGAPSADMSRGFELTSIKAAYVIERLNEVRPCGVGWRYTHSAFEEIETGNGRVEIVTEVSFQYRFHATNGCTGCDPVMWNAQAGDWAFRTGSSNQDWSQPILACGCAGSGRDLHGAVGTSGNRCGRRSIYVVPCAICGTRDDDVWARLLPC